MVTYDEIYQRMRAEYIAQGGAEFDEASDIAIRMRVLAGEIYNAYTNAEWLKKQMFMSLIHALLHRMQTMSVNEL